MIQHVIHINPDGTIETLWTEAIPLLDIGTVKAAPRVSTIEFNPDFQHWEVKLFDRPGIYAHPSRANCIAWEVGVLNMELLSR